MTWLLRRYLDERSPTLKNFAKVVRSFEGRQFDERHSSSARHTAATRCGERGDAGRRRGVEPAVTLTAGGSASAPASFRGEYCASPKRLRD
jgi:hypothetical protein